MCRLAALSSKAADDDTKATWSLVLPKWLADSVRRGHGVILNISSVNGMMAVGEAAYSAAKAGMIGMSKSLAQEVATRGITVNCVAPGMIRSAMTDVLADAQREAILSRIPVADLGTGEDIAAAVIYLASRESRYVTGQTLHVNGGMAML